MTKDKSGKSLEKAVARIQQMLDPETSVTHNEWMTDRLGIRRQFDVVVRGTAMGRNYLGVIECKDWADKVGTPEVEAFIAKARGVNAQIVLMVSNRGYSEPGLKQARFEGVGTLSLLPHDHLDAGFTIGLDSYCVFYEWSDLSLKFSGPPSQNVAQPIHVFSVTLDGKPIINWFLKQLATTYSDATTFVPLEVKFKQPIRVQCDGSNFWASGIRLIGDRIAKAKKGLMQASGDGVWDWQTKELTWPINGKLSFHCTSDMIAKWDDYFGEIPTLGQIRGFIINQFLNPLDPGDVVDLRKYC
jgi:hypothetical protein